MSYITVAIDIMGGDYGPSVTVPAVMHALAQHSQLRVILVGNESSLASVLSTYEIDSARILTQQASQVVEMDELPSLALRNKKDSSMRVAIDLVKEGKADACVSAGNTGALMATARFVLKTLPSINRPAIVSTFPTYLPGRTVRILDLGANVDSEAAHLVQFAVMGSVLTQAIDLIDNPTVYLLNIGAEEIKGNERVKEAARILTESKMVNFAGYIEGDAIYQGKADVVVCDGFVGNIALKVTEGVARFISHMIKEAFMQGAYSKLIGALAKPILKDVTKRIDPARYNGATLLGLRGTVIKSHGSATILGFARAIEEAMMNAMTNIPERIRHQIENILRSSKPDISS